MRPGPDQGQWRAAIAASAQRRGLPTQNVGPPPQPQPVAPQQPVGPRGVTQDRITGELGSVLNDLWNQSNPHTTNIPTASRLMPGATAQSKKQEQGCWIILNTATDALRTSAFPPGQRDGCIPGVPQLGPNEVVGAFFHTHPNTKDEGYNRGPSDADLAFATSNNYPGLVRSQLGGYTWFGPALPQ